MRRANIVLSLRPETKIELDALSALFQRSPSNVVETLISWYVERLPEAQRTAVECLREAATQRVSILPTQAGRREPMATYEFSRLCFRKSEIDPLGDEDTFRVITPAGTFEMTKGEFYQDFPNVVSSRAYGETGIYHYPKTPARAERYRVA